MYEIACDYCGEEYYYVPLIPMPACFKFDMLIFPLPHINGGNRKDLICIECLQMQIDSYVQLYDDEENSNEK